MTEAQIKNIELEIERLKAENALMRAEIEILKAGRITPIYPQYPQYPVYPFPTVTFGFNTGV